MELHASSSPSRSFQVVFITTTFLGALIPIAMRGDVTTGKSPAPDTAAQGKAFALAREVYKEDLEQAKRPAEKAQLSAKLMEAGKAEGKDPAARFVLLAMARDVAIEAGDVEGAIVAIAAMDSTFVVDAVQLRTTSALAAT